MKYETPEVTALSSAINAVQTLGSKVPIGTQDHVNPDTYDSGMSAYEDWE